MPNTYFFVYRMINKNSIILIFTVIFLLSCKRTHVRDFTPKTNFEALWEILDQKYCFFEEKNIDWQGVRNIYEAKLSAVRSHVDMFDLFAQMLDTLQDGHVNLYSQFDVSRCRGWFENYPANFDDRLIYSPRYLGNDYRVGGGFHYRTIADGKIGYMRYSSFSSAVSVSSLRYIGDIFKGCRGIIIDVRNNGGGSLGYSEEFASIFMKESTLTGYIRHKTGKGHSDFSEMQPVYTPQNSYIDWSDKQVVLLVNRRCYSATNDFVCRVKPLPNVTVMGGITGGGGGIPSSNELPNGWMVRFSAVQMLDKNRQQIEFGIEPEIEAELDSADLDNGYDTLIEKAIKLLGGQPYAL